MSVIRLHVLALVLIFFAASGHAQQAPGESIDWEPLVLLNMNLLNKPQLFPSYLLATAMWSGNDSPVTATSGDQQLNILGDRNGAIAVGITNPADNAHIRLVVQMGWLSAVSVFDAVLGKKGEKYLIFPKINYRYDLLPRISQPVLVNAVFTLYVNGAVAGQKTKTTLVRSVNDCPFAIKAPDGHVIDLGWMFAAYINENHPWIDALLREALNTGTIPQFIGYQGSPQDVYQQVFAIWDTLQRRGFTYSNITTPSAYSNQVVSQHVRFLSEAVASSQANCVDGTLLFASILRKIGIDPFLVLIPSHMFLGFYLDKDHKAAAYLETTMMGGTNLGGYAEDNSLGGAFSSLFGVDTRNQASWKSFLYALNAGAAQAQENQGNFTPANLASYKIMDVTEYREIGVMPINR